MYRPTFDVLCCRHAKGQTCLHWGFDCELNLSEHQQEKIKGRLELLFNSEDTLKSHVQHHHQMSRLFLVS